MAKYAEQEVLPPVLGGDEVDVYALYKRHGGLIYSLAYNILKDVLLAEDAVQETIIKVYLKADSFRGEAKFSTWLSKIAVNTAREIRRKERKHQNSEPIDDHQEELLDESGRSAMDKIEVDELFGLIKKGLWELTEKQRKAMLLRLQGHTYLEISEILKVTIVTVKARLYNGRQKLWAFVANQYTEQPARTREERAMMNSGQEKHLTRALRKLKKSRGQQMSKDELMSIARQLAVGANTTTPEVLSLAEDMGLIQGQGQAGNGSKPELKKPVSQATVRSHPKGKLRLERKEKKEMGEKEESQQEMSPQGFIDFLLENNILDGRMSDDVFQRRLRVWREINLGWGIDSASVAEKIGEKVATIYNDRYLLVAAWKHLNGELIKESHPKRMVINALRDAGIESLEDLLAYESADEEESEEVEAVGVVPDTDKEEEEIQAEAESEEEAEESEIEVQEELEATAPAEAESEDEETEIEAEDEEEVYGKIGADIVKPIAADYQDCFDDRDEEPLSEEGRQELMREAEEALNTLDESAFSREFYRYLYSLVVEGVTVLRDTERKLIDLLIASEKENNSVIAALVFTKLAQLHESKAKFEKDFLVLLGQFRKVERFPEKIREPFPEEDKEESEE